MTSTDPAATTLATMSPTMIRALHKVNDGHAHHVHGRALHRRQRLLRVDQQVTAADINFVFQHQRDRFPCPGFLQVAVERHDASDC